MEIWILMLLSIGLDRWSKRSIATIVVRNLFLMSVPIWFSFKIRTGYLCRKPYWTRESWQRFLRLMVSPSARSYRRPRASSERQSGGRCFV